MTNAVVPYEKKEVSTYVYEFKLVEKSVELLDRETVKQQLPDILGRALARSWIDSDYKEKLQRDLKGTLAMGGVIIPEDYECTYETTSGQRAKIVVFECKPNSKLRLRICGFSLTMVATR